MIITIDGPAASGKTTIVTELAKRCGLFYIYSGLLFRAVAYGCTKIHHINIENIQHIDREKILSMCENFGFVYQYTVTTGPQLLYKNTDITALLMSEEIGSFASVIGRNSPVRAFVALWQRSLAALHNQNIIVDGRDAGTEIFPLADIKLFITASIDERIRRLQGRSNNGMSLEQATEIVTHRDNHDSQREDSPLRVAPGAQVIDTTELSVEQMIDIVYKYILEKKEISGSKST